MSVPVQEILSFLFVTVVLRYTVSTLVIDLLDHHFKKWLIRTEHDAIYWLHYRNRAAKQGHHARHPIACDDENCRKLR
jgi:hypothetical protein